MYFCILSIWILFIKSATLWSFRVQRSLLHNTSIPPWRYYRSQTTTMRASRIQSGKCYLHHHGEFDRVCRRPIYKQYRRFQCFSFPSSLKCPFCRQFLRALFDRLFSLAVIILPSWYIMQLSLRMRASHVISFFRNSVAKIRTIFFSCQSRSVVFSFLALWLPQYSPHLLSIRARKCQRCRWSLVSPSTNFGALDFLEIWHSGAKYDRADAV